MSRFGWIVSTVLITLAGVLGLVRWSGARTHALPPSTTDLGELFERAPTDENQAFHYTPPVPLARLATEWEPQRALVLGMALPELMADQSIAHYQRDLLVAAHDLVDVYVFCEHDHTRAMAYFLSLLNELPQAEAVLARTDFVDSRNLSRWTRDYGPVFGIKPNQGLVMLDHVYRNLTLDLEERVESKSDSLRKFMSLQGDAMPGDVAVYLQQRFDTEVDVVRPPLWMDGGDFIHDGKGNVFISAQTLVRNGGNKSALTELFRRYFGAKQLHVLHALPGSTVNHLDMVIKFLDANTVVVADYQSDDDENLNRYRRQLTQSVRTILAENEAYLRKHFPSLRILKMPMPPIMFMSEEEILAEGASEFLQAMAVNWGLTTADNLQHLRQAELRQLEESTLHRIRGEVGRVNLSSVDGFNAVLRHYGQLPMDKYFDMHSESVTRYRSYINSLFLHSTAGRQAFLVPRFSGRTTAETARLTAWESQVATTYHQAWPDAEIRWINCDGMITDMGFIHCTTITVPDWKL
ncbi:agmatine deiminase family protein [Synoicihabitans lomoniglobus]|nr:agmatine deiminase family protein [Opitutaceae bacterium LMO-M01]